MQETKRQNRKLEDLATSSRTDAYGNEVEYVPGVGWVARPTGTTKKLLGAEQHEQLMSFLKDAPRQRKAAERADKRSQMADDEYERQFNNFKYRPQKAKEAYVLEDQRGMMDARRRGLAEATSALGRVMLRQGGGGGLESLFQKSGDMFADTLEDAMFRGRQSGEARHRADQQSEEGSALQLMNFLRAGAAEGIGMPIHFTDNNASMTQRAEQALAALMGTIGQNADRLDQNYARYAEALGQYPDLSGIFSGLGGSFGGGSSSSSKASGGATSSTGFTDTWWPDSIDQQRAAIANGF